MDIRAVLKSHGNGVTVDTSHEETKQTAHSQELLESLAVDGGNLQKTEDDHVENHGPLATILVTSQTEEGGADGTEKQSQGDGSGDICL